MAVLRAQEIIIDIDGMTCAACERHVAEALMVLDGVSAATASHSEGQAVVTADPLVATPEILREAVREAGYEPKDVHFPE